MGFPRFRVGLFRVVPMLFLAGLATGCIWPFAGNEGIGPGQDTGLPPPGAALARQAAGGGGVGPGDGQRISGGVNGFLWRAALDTIRFMPLASADSFGGVIITDWLASQDNPNERFKMTIYILDPDLRADGIKVAIFRQTLRVSGIWADAAIDPESPIKIENAILSRARQLRLRATVG